MNPPAAASAAHGEVVAAFGRRFLVLTGQGITLACVTRGKRTDLACGDRVVVTPESDGSGVIEEVLPRTSLLRRAAAHRTKLLAANATQVAVIVAVEPSWSEELVCRVLAAAADEELKVLLVLNKADLPGAAGEMQRLAPLERAGHPVLALSALHDPGALAARLAGETTVLIGQSGMGKSTLVNALVPEARSPTSPISLFLDSGRHTTSASRLYRLDPASAIIDTPGMKEFGLAHLDRPRIERGFLEMRPFLGRCRFRDCTHQTEPGCALRAALDSGALAPRRLELLRRIIAAEAGRRE